MSLYVFSKIHHVQFLLLFPKLPSNLSHARSLSRSSTHSRLLIQIPSSLPPLPRMRHRSLSSHASPAPHPRRVTSDSPSCVVTASPLAPSGSPLARSHFHFPTARPATPAAVVRHPLLSSSLLLVPDMIEANGFDLTMALIWSSMVALSPTIFSPPITSPTARSGREGDPWQPRPSRCVHGAPFLWPSP